MTFYCSLGLSLTLQVATVMLQACVERLEGIAADSVSKLVENLDITKGVNYHSSPKKKDASDIPVGSDSTLGPFDSHATLAPFDSDSILAPLNSNSTHSPLHSIRGGGEEEAEVDEVLDFLSVLLPAVRVVYDWFLCQKELCARYLPTVKQPYL